MTKMDNGYSTVRIMPPYRIVSTFSPYVEIIDTWEGSENSNRYNVFNERTDRIIRFKETLGDGFGNPPPWKEPQTAEEWEWIARTCIEILMKHNDHI